MSKRSSLYKRHRFPPEIIQHVVWLYHRFNLSSRDIEDIMAERGIGVSYESIRLWCIKFGSKYANRLRRRVCNFEKLVTYLQYQNGTLLITVLRRCLPRNGALMNIIKTCSLLLFLASLSLQAA